MRKQPPRITLEVSVSLLLVVVTRTDESDSKIGLARTGITGIE
jgi:hypothetical protein